MKKLILVIFIFLIVITGCSNESTTPTISAKPDSEYVNTFEDLHLGVLFNFDFHLPEADKRWVNLWVERYEDGEKDTNPVAQLSYGQSPTEVTEGALGFGMINAGREETSVFLYGHGAFIHPQSIIKSTKTTNALSSYAISTEKVELPLGETKLLAVYRQVEGDTIRTFDLQNEAEVQNMIKEEGVVYLLKIMIEEK